MLKENLKADLIKFVSEYPDAIIKTATTMYDGYVSLIKPIKTICGAEIYCSPNTYDEVKNIISQINT